MTDIHKKQMHKYSYFKIKLLHMQTQITLKCTFYICIIINEILTFPSSCTGHWSIAQIHSELKLITHLSKTSFKPKDLLNESSETTS